MWRNKFWEPCNERYSILLLFSRCINVRKEKGNIMATYQWHPTHLTISSFRVIPFLVTLRCFVSFFTFINSFIGNLGCPFLRCFFASVNYEVPYMINVVFWNDMRRWMKRNAFPAWFESFVMEVSVRTYLKISSAENGNQSIAIVL